MNRGYRIWYLLALVVALVLPGSRWMVWQATRPTVLDAAMAQAGEVLFKHEFKPNDSLCADGDGLGPVFNDSSCVACHNQGGAGGGGDLTHNVTMFTVRAEGQPPRQGVLHAHHVDGAKCQETVRDLSAFLPTGSASSMADEFVTPLNPDDRRIHLSHRNTPALFGAKLIDDLPERVILAGEKSQRVKWGMHATKDKNVPVGRALRLADGRIGRFGWKAQMASLSDFVRAACANELGLANPGGAQPVALSAQGKPPSQPGLDLTARQCDEITAFCAYLPRPVERRSPSVSDDTVFWGKSLFATLGCADCHTPKLANVDRLYSDLLLHEMGHDLVGGGSYGDTRVPVPNSKDDGPSPSEWRTPPLWGVADSAPYLHDGRAATLEAAIRMHGGQAQRAAKAFDALAPAAKGQLIAFLSTLRAPTPAVSATAP